VLRTRTPPPTGQPTEPTDVQRERASLMGWSYLGDGLFGRGDFIGWFEGRFFVKA